MRKEAFLLAFLLLALIRTASAQSHASLSQLERLASDFIEIVVRNEIGRPVPSKIFLVQLKAGKDHADQIGTTGPDGIARLKTKCPAGARMRVQPNQKSIWATAPELKCDTKLIFVMRMVDSLSFFILEKEAYALRRYEQSAIAAAEALERLDNLMPEIESASLEFAELFKSDLRFSIYDVVKSAVEKKIEQSPPGHIREAFESIHGKISSDDKMTVAVSVDLLKNYTRTTILDSFIRSTGFPADSTLRLNSSHILSSAALVLSSEGKKKLQEYQAERNIAASGKVDIETLRRTLDVDSYPTIKRAYALSSYFKVQTDTTPLSTTVYQTKIAPEARRLTRLSASEIRVDLR